MKKIFLTAALAFSLVAMAQEGGKPYTVDAFKWTITIPEGYTPSIYDEADYDETDKLVFVIDHEEENYMEVTEAPYSTGEDGDYAEMQDIISGLMKSSLEAQFDVDAEITADLKKEVISGLDFYHHTFVIGYKDEEGPYMTLHLFNTLIGEKDLNVSIGFSDAAEGNKMIKALKESKFK